jgi:diguanylate cyclase (GGDEF)-like protein
LTTSPEPSLIGPSPLVPELSPPPRPAVLAAKRRRAVLAALTGRVKPGFLGTLALASGLALAAVGLIVAAELRANAHEQAVAQAREHAVLIARLTVEPRVGRALVEAVTPEERRALDRAFRADPIRGTVAELTIWSESGRAVYATGGHERSAAAHADELDAARRGEVVTVVSAPEAVAAGRRLLVFMPADMRGADRPLVFEFALPYEPIRRAVERESGAVVVLLATALAAVYALILWVAARASRKLRRKADENEYRALHDVLTSLPNRNLFHDRATQALLGARRESRRAAVMLIDLDGFKEINDSFGHQTGDRLLEQVGRRFRGALREGDTVARLGGDEFGVLLPGLEEGAGAVQAAARLLKALKRPFVVDSLRVDIDASVGIALYPDHGGDVDTLVGRADVAMYVAKETGSSFKIYAEKEYERGSGRVALLRELRQALVAEQLVLYYQPKADIATGEITGAEAFLRWLHPERGVLVEDEFLALAEHTGLSSELRLYMLNRALCQCRTWLDDGLELAVAANLGGRDLSDPQLVDEIDRLLKRWKVNPHLLEVEVAESVILADSISARATLARLSSAGVRVVVDEFGSGYSALGYLKGRPDGIKIEQGFVANMLRRERDAAIVRSTIDLARNLGVEVVAENVDGEAVWRLLAALGCNSAQGTYVSDPVPGEELADRFERRVSVLAAARRGRGSNRRPAVRLFLPGRTGTAAANGLAAAAPGSPRRSPT